MISELNEDDVLRSSWSNCSLLELGILWKPKEDDVAFQAGYQFEDGTDVMRRRLAFWQGVWWQRAQERFHRTFPSVEFEPEDRT